MSYPIEVQHLHKSYRQRLARSATVAIQDLHFNVEPGEKVAVVGRTGCGKSTFFRLLLGLEEPTRGTIEVGGRSPYDDFRSFRGQMAVVFQEDRLLPWRTVMQNVCLGLEILDVPEDEQRKRAHGWLERLGLATYGDAFPHELSGGMRQRVAMARAFVVEPGVLLADEAFGHLDEVTAEALRTEFLNLVAELGSTTMFVTHNLSEAIEMGERVLVLGSPGRLLGDLRLGAESGDVREQIQRMITHNASDAVLTEDVGASGSDGGGAVPGKQ